MNQSTQPRLAYDEHGRAILPLIDNHGNYRLDSEGRVMYGPRPTAFPRLPDGKMRFRTKLKWLLFLGVDYKAPFQY